MRFYLPNEPNIVRSSSKQYDLLNPEKLPERYKKILTGEAPKQTLNEWVEVYCFDSWPSFKLVQALFRPLNTLDGESPDQYVALRYQQGEAVMGRVWKNKADKIEASFSWNNHCIHNPSGAILILCELPDVLRGFDYNWLNFPEAAVFGSEKEWFPVHVDNLRKDISPGVLIVNDKEILGKVDVRNERATVGHNGKVYVQDGLTVHSCKVLCRKAKPGCKFETKQVA